MDNSFPTVYNAPSAPGRHAIDSPDKQTPPIVSGWRSWLVFILALLVIAAFVFSPPWNLLAKARLIGYAVCHQIPERSFHIHGEQFPLCARCTGTFVGALTGFVVLTALRRRRAGSLPAVPILVVLILFIAAMGVDGLNSYLTFFPNLPHAYQPHNVLRLATGMLNGVALSIIVFPVFNYTLWRDVVERPVLKNAFELALILLVAGGLGALAYLEVSPMLYPLAIAGALGVLVMLTALNTMIVLAVLGREGIAGHWHQAVLPLTVGLAAAVIEIGAIDMGRAYMTRTMGLPF